MNHVVERVRYVLRHVSWRLLAGSGVLLGAMVMGLVLVPRAQAILRDLVHQARDQDMHVNDGSWIDEEIAVRDSIARIRRRMKLSRQASSGRTGLSGILGVVQGLAAQTGVQITSVRPRSSEQVRDDVERILLITWTGSFHSLLRLVRALEAGPVVTSIGRMTMVAKRPNTFLEGEMVIKWFDE